ncbi:MAG: hypothetical protein QOF52_2152, partial [Propionibacteriaceae bacterium]|nr:hypothetical protein [Propionibacteriaceae bacterium]
MVSRRIRPLTAADLDNLPDPCSVCTFWEAGLIDLATSSEHTLIKRNWAEAVTARGGYCGVMAV